MPKILINEFDETSSGTPGSYENYSVLIAGFTNRKPVTPVDVEEAKANGSEEIPIADKIQPDSNGVYEFTSRQDFEDTIGLVPPKVKVKLTESESEQTIYHYGNQMAYELLNLGYTVIYKPIGEADSVDASTVSKLTDADFWEIFKDKASYDFRFITHGLLKSSEYPKIYKENDITLTELNGKKTALENALKKENIDEASYNEYIEIVKDVANLSDEKTTLTAEEYGELAPKYQGFFKKMEAEPDSAYKLCTFTELKETKLSDEIIYDIYCVKIKTTANLSDEKTTLTEEEFVSLINEYKVYEVCFKNTAETGKANAYGLRDYKDITDEQNATNDKISDIELAQEELKSATLTTEKINTVNTNIAKLAAYKKDNTELVRGDCTALIELDENTYTDSSEKPEAKIMDAMSKMTVSSDVGMYCAMTVPSVVYKGVSKADNFGNNKKLPGAFHYLACFMRSLNAGFKEWYAAAGYTRGVSDYNIDYTTVKLGEIAINALEPRAKTTVGPAYACNVIANFRGSYYLWGNRTAHELDPAASSGDLKAWHFLNIRQLCTTIKKQLYVACRRFTFDPNSDTLWFNFVNSIRPTLEAMKADQGIRDYRIVKEPTTKKATLAAKIRIIPIEAVEDFDLEVSLEDSFGDVTVNVD